MATIGKRIEHMRLAQGVSATELARAAGVSLSAIRQLEKGVSKNPRPDTLLRIARRLGTTMEEIVDPLRKPGDPRNTPALSPQAQVIAQWFDALSEGQRRRAYAYMLLATEPSSGERREPFPPLPPPARTRARSG